MQVRASAFVRAIVIAALAASPLAAQQSGGTLPPIADTVGPNRFHILAREIDSASAIAGRMQIAAAAREQTAQAASRFLLLSQVARGLERRRTDWVSAVTVAGVMQLQRTSLFSSGEPSPGIWGTLRGGGQFAGLAAITGGASWLLSNLTPYSPRFGVAHPRATHRR
jgi:hypothetical protein